MTDLPATMYTDEEDSTPIKNKTPIPSTLVAHSMADVKSYYITIGDKQIEVVKKSYVESIEHNLTKTKRDLRTAQTRMSQLLRAVAVLTGDVRDLRRQLNARGRFD